MCVRGGGYGFNHPERRGDGPGDYSIYLQPLRGNWRAGGARGDCCVGQVAGGWTGKGGRRGRDTRDSSP